MSCPSCFFTISIIVTLHQEAVDIVTREKSQCSLVRDGVESSAALPLALRFDGPPRLPR